MPPLLPEAAVASNLFRSIPTASEQYNLSPGPSTASSWPLYITGSWILQAAAIFCKPVHVANIRRSFRASIAWTRTCMQGALEADFEVRAQCRAMLRGFHPGDGNAEGGAQCRAILRWFHRQTGAQRGV